MKKQGKIIGRLLVLLALLILSQSILGEDETAFIRWWLAALFLGIGCFPLCEYYFSEFLDHGYLAAKVFGIALAGFGVWLLANMKLPVFTSGGTMLLSGLLAASCWGISYLKKKREKTSRTWSIAMWEAVLDGEILFTLFFLLWTYAAGFRPEAYGTEKFMDYGFMMSMMRSKILPAKDLWYAGENLNYYYGGQYFAVFLTKLTSTQIAQTYHLMRTMVAGFAFALPFTLVRQMLTDNGRKKVPAVFGGLLAGAGVSLAGNMHYVVIGKILPWIRNVFSLPQGEYTYWFPNSTRYIGYYPAEHDKTIHEFPSYSFVLGDLHAHVVNVMFVLALICLIYAMVQKQGDMEIDRTQKKKITFYKKEIKRALLDPYILLFSFLIGMFHWTNYWDFVIYYVMGGMGVIWCNYKRYAPLKRKHRFRMTAKISILHAVWVFVLGSIFALPFTLQFQSMVSEVALAQNHSRPYQWWLIWGLPVAVCLLYGWCLKKEGCKKADSFGILLAISALGLIVIPEIVYVRDIYEQEYARSNTMFKLTYQAFMMFGILMAYAFVRMWKKQKQWIQKILTTVAFVCFVGCCFYTVTAVHAWFGQVWETDQYQGLDATAYLETTFPEDAGAIRWLNETVSETPVVLEANGDSYSDYERVSAMTGLPTILGWYVHEWLWRGDIVELNQRVTDVENIYTSGDAEIVEELLQKYEVEYIFVGAREREKYENLNEEMLQSLGTIAYMDAQSQTYVLKVALERER